MRRRVQRVLSLVAMLSVAACGSASTSLTQAQWRARATTICNTAAASITRGLAAMQDATNVTQAISYLRTAARLTTRTDDELQHLSGPANVASAARTVIRDNTATIKAEDTAISRLSGLRNSTPANMAELDQIDAPLQSVANRGEVRAAASPIPASCVLVP